MLLIGSTNLTRTTSTGDFFCPHCKAIRDYRLRSRRPFLTVYFIPMVPIGPIEQYVQCSDCGTRSPVEALQQVVPGANSLGPSRSTSNALQGDLTGTGSAEELLHAAVLVVLADGFISEKEIDALLRVGNKLGVAPLDREELGAICSSASLNRILPTNYIATVARSWNERQKREALKVLFYVCTADQLGESQLQLLAWLQQHFDLSDNDYQLAVDEVVDYGLDAIAW